jgi:undecaprenyl-diphosphatase
MAVFVPAWALLALLWLAFGDGHLEHWLAAPPFNSDLRPLFRALSEWGIYVFYVFFLGLLIWGWRTGNAIMRRIGLAYLLAQVIGSLLIVRSLKVLCGRPRPGRGSADAAFCPGPTLESGFNAFPSGHTVDVTIGAIFIAVLLRRGRWGYAAFALAASVALSRIVLGSHHYSDVIGGVAIGAAVAFGVLRRPSIG